MTLTHTPATYRLLRWLARQPFLCAQELKRCLGWSTSAVYKYLHALEQENYLEQVTLSEPGSARHRRYYLTDQGLALVAAHTAAHVTSADLVRHYALGEQALCERLLSPTLLLRCADLLSRIAAAGRPGGYRLLSWQQPWVFHYTHRHKNYRLSIPALLFLRGPLGTRHAACLYIDTGERRFQYERRWWQRFLTAHAALWWNGTRLPPLLIVTERQDAWEDLFSQASENRKYPLPAGGSTTRSQVTTAVFAPIWSPIPRRTPEPIAPSSLVTLPALLGPPATPTGVASREPATSASAGAAGKVRRQQQQQVRGRLMQRTGRLARRPVPAELLRNRREAAQTAALLTLILPAREKAVIAALSRHPWMSVLDLVAHLTAENTGVRSFQRSIVHLLRLGLLCVRRWPAGSGALDQERYRLTETALRWLAMRERIACSDYLEFSEHTDSHAGAREACWTQRGVDGLGGQQMSHTAGVYRCVLTLKCVAYRRGEALILNWKNAQEAVRWYRHPESGNIMTVRPDAEITLGWQGSEPLTFLVEYDRATMKTSDLVAKIEAYQDYQAHSGIPLPPILFVTQHSRQLQHIRQAATILMQQGRWLPLTLFLVLEHDLLGQGPAALAFLLARGGKADGPEPSLL